MPREEMHWETVRWQEQEAVVALVVGQVEAIVEYHRADKNGESPKPVEQMVLLLHGEGGTGKTEVVTLLRRLFREVLGQASEMAVASSNSAARVIGGETIHSAFGLSAQQALTIAKLSGQKVKDDFVDRMNELEAVIVEEVSMVPPKLLGAASLRMCKAREGKHGSHVGLYMERGHMFGKVPIVMFLGDFYQLGPVMGGAGGLPCCCASLPRRMYTSAMGSPSSWTASPTPCSCTRRTGSRTVSLLRTVPALSCLGS